MKSLNIMGIALGFELSGDDYVFEYDVVFTINEIQYMKLEEQGKWYNLLGKVNTIFGQEYYSNPNCIGSAILLLILVRNLRQLKQYQYAQDRIV